MTSQNKILDGQFKELDKETFFCKKCVVSNQRPRITFNSDGVCSACQWAYEKDNVVDWKKRENELVKLLDKFRSKTGDFDVVVPGSGGKDSAFVAHQLKHRFGMNPLCVTWAPFQYSSIGWTNFKNFIDSGYNNILGHADGVLHKKLARIAFDLKGDPWEPFTFGQKAWAYHMANKFNVKLIFYGENGELEYGGSSKYKEVPCEGVEDWEKHYFKGAGVSTLIEQGLQSGVITPQDVKCPSANWYKPIEAGEIVKSGMEMHWFSYYQKWVPQENFYYAATHTNFETNNFGRSEGTYTKYASLDDKLDGFHWYLSYIKFGMGRASRDAQQDIRRHHITREEGVKLVRKFDGEFPAKYFEWFLEYLDIDETYFNSVIDKYKSVSNVWEKKSNVWTLKHVVE